MARTSRQSKILELISTKEIETQDELVSELKRAKFNITQATISRDIKELGLIKILSAETGKYKYSIIENGNQAISNKYINVFKSVVIAVKSVQNLCVIKTIKGMASGVCSLIDKFNIDKIVGTVYGADTVMLILENSIDVKNTTDMLNDLLY